MAELSKFLQPKKFFNSWLHSHVPYKLAHSENFILFLAIWVSFLVVFLANVLVAYPPQTSLDWLLLGLNWLVLLPADTFLPGSKARLSLRLGYLGLETALVMMLGRFDNFAITGYICFALVGQAAYIFPLFTSLAYVAVLGVLKAATVAIINGERAVLLSFPLLTWVIGALFTLIAVSVMRKAREQHARIAELLEKLEATTTLVQCQAEELARQVKEDSLTGLSNRRYMDEILPREMERSRRLNHNLSLAIIDIDFFKSVNDRFSHLVGDQVLKALAQVLHHNCRAAIDSVIRYGGEEFVLIFPETSPEEAVEICERVRRACQHYNWDEIQPGLSLTISIGIADARTATSSSQLLDSADHQLYRAKQSGRNRVCSP